MLRKSRRVLRAVVIERDPDTPLLTRRREIEVVGRFAQTLQALVDAGPKGVTALDVGGWAVRLSHYIHVLRNRHRLDIETVREDHGGDFPGRHGRYFLLSTVIIPDADHASEAA